MPPPLTFYTNPETSFCFLPTYRIVSFHRPDKVHGSACAASVAPLTYIF
jgi:hypothetical protein